MPAEFGLWGCGIMIRKTNHPNVQQIETAWWDEINSTTPRDQLSLPYILWKNDYKIDTINIKQTSLLDIVPHKE
jgi:hypothetical protein